MVANQFDKSLIADGFFIYLRTVDRSTYEVYGQEDNKSYGFIDSPSGQTSSRERHCLQLKLNKGFV